MGIVGQDVQLIATHYNARVPSGAEMHGNDMSLAVFGRVSNLRIGCGHGERHFYGSVVVEGTSKTIPNWPTQSGLWVEGFVDIFGERSEECYSLLMAGAKEGQIQQLLKGFSELTSLAVVRRHRESLGVIVMLNTADFTWFSSFVETHFFRDLEYLLHLPIAGFAQDVRIEMSLPAIRKAYVPTPESFFSGMPFYIPNESIPVMFQHLTDQGAHKYKWIEDQKEWQQRADEANSKQQKGII